MTVSSVKVAEMNVTHICGEHDLKGHWNSRANRWSLHSSSEISLRKIQTHEKHLILPLSPLQCRLQSSNGNAQPVPIIDTAKKYEMIRGENLPDRTRWQMHRAIFDP